MKLLLLLSQLCVFEADFSNGNEDCAAIVQVLRARGLLSERGIHAYSPHFRAARYRQWIHSLDFSGDKPAGWPVRGRDWTRYRARWYRTIADTAHGMAGYEPCPPGTKHWGAPGFRAAYWYDLGWRPQQCGNGTHNWFWKKTRRAKAKRHRPEYYWDTSLLSPYGYFIWMTTAREEDWLCQPPSTRR